MTFWRPSTMSPPRPDLAVPALLWDELIEGLRARGSGRRESGAFLLGKREPSRRASEIVFYDAIDPHAFDTGIIVIDGGRLGALWRMCRERSLTVVADVHTHPFGAGQSDSDRRHPIVAEPGHVALIIPDFAMRGTTAREVSAYRYLGDFRWLTLKQGGLTIEGDAQ